MAATNLADLTTADLLRRLADAVAACHATIGHPMVPVTRVAYQRADALELAGPAITRADFLDRAPEAFHAAFRKATDAPNAMRIHRLITNLAPGEWATVMGFVADALGLLPEPQGDPQPEPEPPADEPEPPAPTQQQLRGAALVLDDLSPSYFAPVVALLDAAATDSPPTTPITLQVDAEPGRGHLAEADVDTATFAWPNGDTLSVHIEHDGHSTVELYAAGGIARRDAFDIRGRSGNRARIRIGEAGEY